MIKLAFSLLSLLFIPSTATAYFTKNDRLKVSCVDRLRKKYMVPGVAIALIDNSRVSLNYLGYSDIKHKKKTTSNTTFQLGSIAKPITALASLKLIDKHGYNLNDSVEKILKSNVSHPDQLTFRRLLSHTSGLNYLISHGALSESDYSKSISLNQLKTVLNQDEKFLYTAAGYYLIQLVLENLEKEEVSSLLKKNVLTPLGLNHSSFNYKGSSSPAKGYSLFRKELPVVHYHEKTASSLNSNLEDMSLFVQSFWNGKLLNLIGAKHFEEILDANKNEYNLGFAVEDCYGDKYLSHHGTNRGWNAYFGFLLNQKKGIVVLTNSDWGLSFIDHFQRIWLEQLTGKKTKYKPTLSNLSVDCAIALTALFLLSIIF